MARESRLLSVLCVIAGVACLASGTILFVGSRNLFDAGIFGQRAAKSLSDPGVAAYAANFATNSAIKARPDLIAVRPLIMAMAESIVAARPFRALVATAATRAHEAVFSEGARRMILSLPDLNVLVHDALAQANPALSAKIPKQLESVFASLGDSPQAQFLLDSWRWGRRMRWFWRALMPCGILLLVFAVWFAPDRRHGLATVGLACILLGAFLAALVPAGGFLAAMNRPPLEAGLLRGLWRTYTSDLWQWGLFFGGLGVLVAAGAASLLETVDLAARIRRLRERLSTPPVSSLGRSAWGAGWLLAGIAGVRYPGTVLNAAVVVVAVCAAFFGARDLFRLFLERLSPVLPEPGGRVRWGRDIAWITGAIVLLSVIWFVWRRPGAPPPQDPNVACNGDAELCGRRLDEVVFPGTHNSMSNESVPDWMFPEHEASISQQLRDGIRALLIDVHYGFSGGARIKTDLTTEPLIDQVKRTIGKEAYEAALRIRNRLVGVNESKRGLYLCHGLCELGASELETTLREIRRFLVSHPDEVLLIIVEDYVTPEDLASAFNHSGLANFVYRGPFGPPWPTLRELIASGGRVLVFLESGRPGVSWLPPAYPVFRETPYTFHKPDEFSCRANRGGDTGSLFLLNHWIETAPTPKPSNAAIVNSYSFLLSRARKCMEERQHLPNVIAVDFYKTGDLFRVVDELNEAAQKQKAGPP